jgi:hypothetical protein
MRASDEAIEAASWHGRRPPRPTRSHTPPIEAAAPHLTGPLVDALKVERKRIELLLEVDGDVELMRWKLRALAEWAQAMVEESNSPQYGRDVKTILEVQSLDEAHEIDAL